MALSGLEIYKLLPKTNCKKCGFPTCLAFAIALAAKKVSLDKCSDVSEEVKKILLEASEPPIKTLIIKDKYKIGGETVLFRHEKTFHNPCLLGVLIKDTFSDSLISERIQSFKTLEFERVGQKYKTEVLLVKVEQNDINKVKSILSQIENDVVLILLTDNTEIFEKVIKIKKVDIVGILKENEKIEKFINIAKQNNIAVIVGGNTLDEISDRIKIIIEKTGYRELIINIPYTNYTNLVENLTHIRRLAIKRNFRTFGYPTFVLIEDKDIANNIALSSAAILKYGSIVIVNSIAPELHLALVTLRLNIYTDPQKPVTVEPKLYKIGGEPKENSPLMVTTNFSLTYYSVEPEIINSKIPSWLLVVDTDGLSVLTAWAAEKFTPEKVVESLKKENVEEKVKNKRLIIPGYVATMSSKLGNLLPEWEIIVGPKEASGIPKFLKTLYS